MKYIFLFFVITYFNITYCMIDKKLQGDIEENLLNAQKGITDIRPNISLGLATRDSLVLHRNKLLGTDFLSDIKLFSTLKKIFNVASGSCLLVGITCPIISLFGKFFSKIDSSIVYMISVLMNIAPPLLKTFVVYADDQLSLKERLQVLYSGNIADFYQNIAVSSEHYNQQNAKDNRSIVKTDENLITENKPNEFNVLSENVTKQKTDIDIKEIINNISDRTRNKLHIRIRNHGDSPCRSTERILKLSAFMKFSFYGGSMVHAIIPSLSAYFSKQEPQNEWDKDKIFSSCLDAINLVAVPLLTEVHKHLIKLDAKIDDLLKADILFLLYKRNAIGCEANVQAKQVADETPEAETIEIAEKSVPVIDGSISVVEETM